jgi:glycosyltransferase involved in cell wall biosynthesis
VPTNDVARLVAAVDEVVVLGPERRREAGRAARARIAERFSMERTRASFDSVYSELRGQAG